MNLFLAATSLLFIASSASAATNLRGVEQPRFLSHSSTKSTKKTKSSSGNSSEGGDYRSVCVISSSCVNVRESDIKNAALGALRDFNGSSSSDKSSSKNSKKSRTRHLHSSTSSGSSGSKSKSGSSSSSSSDGKTKTFAFKVDNCSGSSRSSGDIRDDIEKQIGDELSSNASSSGSSSSRRGRRLSHKSSSSSSGSSSGSSSSSSGDGDEANLKMLCFYEDDLEELRRRCYSGYSSGDDNLMELAEEMAKDGDFRRRHLGSLDFAIANSGDVRSSGRSFSCSD